MLIARWQIDAKFGQKQTAIDHLNTWIDTIAPQIGIRREDGRLMTGSIGAREATLVHEWEVPDLVALDKAWAALAKIDAHKRWGAELEPHVVSGSARWKIYRVL
jgi:hypothetical protein